VLVRREALQSSRLTGIRALRFRHCACSGRRRTPKPRLHRTAEWTRQECDFVIHFTGEGAAGFYERLGVEEAFERRVDDSVLMVSDDLDLSGVFVFPYSMRA